MLSALNAAFELSLDRRRWRPVPPGADERRLPRPDHGALQCWQERPADLPPAPPVVPDDAGCRTVWWGIGRLNLQRWVEAVKRYGSHGWKLGLCGWLQDPSRQQITASYPFGALGFIRVVPVVAIDADERVVHAISVKNGATGAGNRREDSREPKAAHPLHTGLENEHDVVASARSRENRTVGKFGSGRPYRAMV